MSQSGKDYQQGYDEGLEAVRQKPVYAPQNPYDDVTEKDKFNGWEEGSYDAGITEIYTNGVLNKSER